MKINKTSQAQGLVKSQKKSKKEETQKDKFLASQGDGSSDIGEMMDLLKSRSQNRSRSCGKGCQGMGHSCKGGSSYSGGHHSYSCKGGCKGGCQGAGHSCKGGNTHHSGSHHSYGCKGGCQGMGHSCKGGYK